MAKLARRTDLAVVRAPRQRRRRIWSKGLGGGRIFQVVELGRVCCWRNPRGVGEVGKKGVRGGAGSTLRWLSGSEEWRRFNAVDGGKDISAMGGVRRSGFGEGGSRLPWSARSGRPWWLTAVEWRTVQSEISFPDLIIWFLFCGLMYLYLCFVGLSSVIRVVFTHYVWRAVFTLYVLILCRIRFITGCPVKRAIRISRRVLVTPIWPEFCFGASFLRELSTVRHRAFQIPRRVFLTPIWPELGFGAFLLREFMSFGSLFPPIWYSDTLQKIMFGKRIITVADGFGPQSLVGDPVLVVYSLGIFCIFNGFVCLFHSTSLFRELYVLLIELLSAVMDFVQFKD